MLVNNAGVGQVVPLALMEEEDWDRMMGVNVKGAFLVSQAVLRGMIRARRGRIVNISSLAGVKMMQAPSTTARRRRRCAASPRRWPRRSAATASRSTPGARHPGGGRQREPARAARCEEYLRNCALGRVGTFAEIAEVVAFVAWDRNSYMNGATVVLDGAV